jgi:hypothetical protein
MRGYSTSIDDYLSCRPGYVRDMDQTPHPSPPEEESAAETLSPPLIAAPSPEPAASDPSSSSSPAEPVPAPAPSSSARTPTGRMRAAARPQLGQEIGGKKFRVGTGDEYVPFRSRTKRRRKVIAAGVFCAVIVGAGAYGVVTLVGSDPKPKAVAACRAEARSNANPAAVLRPVNDLAGAGAGAGGQAAAAQFKLNVYNSTNRNGLAAGTASLLKQRGFVIGKVTNDPLKADLTIPAEVRGAAASTQAMRIVAAEVAGSRLRTDTRADGTVDLVLGTGFTALASPDQVSAALASPTPGTSKKAAVCH